MRLGLLQVVTSVGALLVAIFVIIQFASEAARIGSEPLLIRGLLLNLAVLGALVAVYPLNPLFKKRPGAYAAAVCLPATLPAFIYFLVFLPLTAGAGLSAQQLQSQLITDNSSNGIIEVGFAYPIFTPTISVTNRELFTRQVNVFLLMTDADGENSLYRAVRTVIPGSGLNVEATVRGMLSQNGDYLFNPLNLPPQRAVVSKVVFVISNLDEGTSFSEAMERTVQAEFELRDPANGAILSTFPLQRI